MSQKKIYFTYENKINNKLTKDNMKILNQSNPVFAFKKYLADCLRSCSKLGGKSRHTTLFLKWMVFLVN